MPTTAAAVFLKRTRGIYANQKQRARKYGYALPYTLSGLREWVGADLFATAVVRCAYCQGTITEADFCLDHSTPVGRRVDAFTWELENLALCCADCNVAKDRLTSAEFGQLQAAMREWPPQARTNVLARLKAGARRVVGK